LGLKNKIDATALISRYQDANQIMVNRKQNLSASPKFVVISYSMTYNIKYMYIIGDFTMKAISYTAVRSSLAKTMEDICDDHEPVVITRKNERSVVMLSLEDYEALEETSYLLRSPKNMRRLIESISQLEKGDGSKKELSD